MQKNPLSRLLCQLLCEITRKPRYFPDFEWSRTYYDENGVKHDSLWTHNVFRFFGSIFGEYYGMRPSVASSPYGQVGYTLEAQLALFEVGIRAAVKKKIPKVVFIPRMELAGMRNMGMLPYRFAIAFDAASGATTTSSLAHTCTGSNLLLVGFFIGDINPTDNLTAATYAGASMSFVINIRFPSDRWTDFYIKTGPATGANNIVQTGNTFTQISGCSYTGCAQTGQPDGTGSTLISLGASHSVTVTVTASNCWLVGSFYAPGGFSGSGGSAIRGSAAASGATIADSNATVGTGSQTLTVNNTTDNAVCLGMSIAPSGGAVVTAIYTPQLLTLNAG